MYTRDTDGGSGASSGIGLDTCAAGEGVAAVVEGLLRGGEGVEAGLYDLTMFTSQSGLDKLTAAIESALGGRGSSNTSGCSADENDINCSNGNENGGVADMTAKRGGGGAGSSVLRDAADGTSRKQNAYYEQVIMSAPGTGNTQPSGSSHGMPPGRAVGKHESHGAPRAHVMGATAEKARTATVSKGSSLSSRSSE